MTPDELRALADAWKDCEVGLILGEPHQVKPGVLARDHADLLDWAERAAAEMECDNYQFGTRGSCYAPEEPMCPSCALLSEWDAMKERP